MKWHSYIEPWTVKSTRTHYYTINSDATYPKKANISFPYLCVCVCALYISVCVPIILVPQATGEDFQEFCFDKPIKYINTGTSYSTRRKGIQFIIIRHNENHPSNQLNNHSVI